MKHLKKIFMAVSVVMSAQYAGAHYPYVAPLSYQTFNNNTAVLSGFYDNPFASEVAIKNFKFHYHTPTGEKIYIDDEQWSKTKTLASYSLENKLDGTYRIRGEKEGNTRRYAFDGNHWKDLIQGSPKEGQVNSDKVIYTSQLDKNAQIKSVKVLELIETFVSRRMVSNHVIQHIHPGFDVQFITHPNAIKANEPIRFKLLDQMKGIAGLNAEILMQTTDFSRDQKVHQVVKSNAKGELDFKITEAGQYLLTVDYQQSFDQSSNELNRYKYTLAFNVIN
jgi:uncharacterized GH25 family protein